MKVLEKILEPSPRVLNDIDEMQFGFDKEKEITHVTFVVKQMQVKHLETS